MDLPNSADTLRQRAIEAGIRDSCWDIAPQRFSVEITIPKRRAAETLDRMIELENGSTISGSAVAGSLIYSVSTATHFAHKAWHDSSPAIRKMEDRLHDGRRPDRYHLSRNFKVMIEADGIADCGIFVVDPAGKIQIVEITARQPLGRDAKELLRKIKATRSMSRQPPRRGLPGEVA